MTPLKTFLRSLPQELPATLLLFGCARVCVDRLRYICSLVSCSLHVYTACLPVARLILLHLKVTEHVWRYS